MTLWNQLQQSLLSRVRGRINLLSMEKHQLLERGKVACQFDELTINTARNRFVWAALTAIAMVKGIRPFSIH